MPRLSPVDINHKQYDFIVIGGGTAGCVVANRLSSNNQYSVLLLEAGESTQEDLLDVRIPLFNSKLKNTSIDWKLKSVIQPEANDRVIGVPQGKILGGSSAINACLYHRCTPSDYDAWNMPSWTYQQLQPYFQKGETFHDQKSTVPEDIHGVSGPLHISQMDSDVPLGIHFKKACKNYGLEEFYDISDRPSQIGVTNIQATAYNGERSSTGSSYLPPAIQNHRSNLFIGLGCTVNRIVLDSNKKVTHVEYTANNESDVYQVSVNREVILSAGAIISPYLLLTSGIGPKAELENLGIDVLVDLPGVGKNLQNHWRLPLVHETTQSEMSLHQGIFKKEKESLELALTVKHSPLTRCWPDAVAYIKIPNAPDNSSSIENTPQIELFVGGLGLCNKISTLKDTDCATLLMVYVTPFSTGSVTLNKEKKLTIDVGLLRDERDLECIEKGLLECIKIADDSVYKDNCIKRWILHPDPNEKQPDKEKLREYVKTHVDTIHHYAGTCKMGNEHDNFAVVNDHLNVFGVQNLRVVDASFFPIVPAGQICYPVIACAERASDIILEDNK